MSEYRTTESESDADTEHLVGLGFKKVVEGGGHLRRRDPRRPTPTLEFLPAVIPENGHQREYEVCLVEWSPHAVDTDKNLGHLLFVDHWRHFKRCEGVLLEIKQAVQVVADSLLLRL